MLEYFNTLILFYIIISYLFELHLKGKEVKKKLAFIKMNETWHLLNLGGINPIETQMI